MLIEHRVYTLALGMEQAFWDAQKLRGTGLEPILERSLGSFATRSGTSDEIVSLYRWDSLEDGQNRLQGIYSNAALQPYFQAVRPLIVEQKNKLLQPAPLAALSPHWGHGRDWLPDQGPLCAGATVIEETTWTLRAGGLPALWAALRSSRLGEDEAFTSSLLGVFSSVVGPLNQVVFYRHFTDANDAQSQRQKLNAMGAWQEVRDAVRPLFVRSEVALLHPSDCHDMAPLFRPF